MATEQEVLRFLMDTSGRTPKFYPADSMQQVGVVPMGGFEESLGQQQPEESGDGVLQRLANLVAPVANLAGLPGSAVRDVLTLRNPLDQFMTPFSIENRTSGRQMIRDYGLAGEEDTYLNAILGAIAELGTDPLVFLGTGVPQMAAKATASGVSAMAPTLGRMVPGAVKNAGASLANKASGLASGLASRAKDYAQPAANAVSDRLSSMINAAKTPAGSKPTVMSMPADFISNAQVNYKNLSPEMKKLFITNQLAGASLMASGSRENQTQGDMYGGQ